MPPQSLKTAAARQTPALPKVDDGKIDFDTIEALFFAYRDFVSDPDVILSKLDYGRAHHRVVYFVSRQPGMTVADLLDTLQITKQSLARVLKQLIDEGYIRQMAGPEDRRQRRLYDRPRTGVGAQRTTITPHRPRAGRPRSRCARLRAQISGADAQPGDDDKRGG